MNRMLWRKAIGDAWLQLVVSAAILVLFGWLFVWLMSQFRTGAVASFLQLLPDFAGRMLGVPLADLATPTGRLSILYVHVVPLLVLIGWAVGRGSAVVSGEISRGTMDLLLSLPVRRVSVLVSSGVVAAAGTAVLSLSVWLGHGLGLATVALEEPVSLVRFLPGALNLAAMTFCLTAITTFLSSCDRDRWRTILLAGGVFTISMVLKFVARLWPAGEWLKYLTFLTAYEPQQLILAGRDSGGPSAWQYNATLVGVGLAAYLAAAAVLAYRDIPQAR
ncbi:MAG: ABC transporter permease [Thermoguttaceae bacterium]|jgi:ABC-2 type transport system permease protein|nr:ABC transporter permease [Thermoguttaceae bacterium]